jgi:hypothetical protein
LTDLRTSTPSKGPWPIKKEVRLHPKQVYVPKKEVPAVPIEAIKQTSIMINSLEVLVNKIEEPIVIENLV